jgi:hypothetical protein
MVYYRLDGRSKVLEIEDFEDFLEDNDIKAGYQFAKGGAIKKKVYKLGDMYSSDFDYDGMLRMGLKADSSWGSKKLEKLFDSFEDVNYHTASKNLWNAIKELEKPEANIMAADNYIEQFHDDVIEEMISYRRGGNVKFSTGGMTEFGSIPKQNKIFGFFEDGGNVDYAKGGKVKKRVRFVDKVESIADRLDGTKVPKNLKKDYGGRYNREEAEEAGRRIAGAQLRDRKMAKGGIVVSKISDIPDLQKKVDEGKVTYRGLGMGKLFNDFYAIAGQGGSKIKVEGKEYFITDEDFEKLGGIKKIRFSAPSRKMSDGGVTKEKIKIKSYNIHGQEIKIGDVLIDYENETIQVPSGKVFKVVPDRDYTVKFQKKQIKASGGIKGLVEFINEINNDDSPFNPAITNQIIEL